MDVPCQHCRKTTVFLVAVAAPKGGFIRVYRCLSCHRFSWVKEHADLQRSGSPESTDPGDAERSGQS
jgi:hypothetical protein